jgi:tetratricopeptide (TPR) repeat protein
VEAPPGLPGRSLLLPPQAGEPSYFEALSTSLNRGWAPLRGVLREGRKWIDLPLPELYDLPADPGETDNLAAEQRRAAAELRALLPREERWPPRQGAVSAEEEARLRSLGYAVGSAAAKAEYGPEDDPKRLIAVDRELHRAIDLYSRGHYQEAAQVALAVVAERPEVAEAYQHAALALRQLERHDEAIALLRRGLPRVAAQESLRRHLGQALAETGNAAEAVPLLAAYAEDGDSRTLAALGIALSDTGRHEEGLTVLRRLLALDPEDPKGHESMGIVLLRLQRDGAARDALRRALELNPSLPIAWNTLGVALYRLEGPEPALAAWRRAVELDPAQYDALYNLGLVAAQLGRRDEARAALARFAATAPPQRFGEDLAKARAMLRELGG